MANKLPINLITLLSLKKWEINENGKSFFFKILPPKELNLPESFTLSLPKGDYDITTENINSVIKTIANIYKYNQNYLKILLTTENFSDFSDEELTKKLEKIKEEFENIRFLRGSSFLFDTFIIIDFKQIDKVTFSYEYFNFIKYKERLYWKGLRTKFSLETIESLDKDPYLFALDDAEQQSKNAMRAFMVEILDKDEYKINYLEIKNAVNFNEISSSELMNYLMNYSDALEYLKKTQSEELKALVVLYEKLAEREKQEI